MNERVEQFYQELDKAYASATSLQDVETFLLQALEENTAGCKFCFNTLETTICNELGSFYRGAGEFQKSVEAFERAKALIAQHIGDRSVEYATVVNNLAGTYRVAGELNKAKLCFIECAAIYEGTIGKDNTLYCSVLNNLALVYQDEGDYENAEENLRSALAFSSTLPQEQPECAITLSNIGALYLAKNELDQAKEFLVKSVEAYNKVNMEDRMHLAAVYNSLGSLYFKEGNPNKALDALEKAKKLTYYYFGENHEYKSVCDSIAYVKASLDA